MGLFGGKIRTVSSSTMNLASAGVDPLVDAILLAIMEERSIPDELLKTLIKGMALKMRRVVKYAKSDYTLGLPTGQTAILPNYESDDIIDAILDETGFTNEIVIDSHNVIELSPAVALLPTLETLRGYDISTNVITHPPTTLVPPTICTEWVPVEYDGEHTIDPPPPVCVAWGPDPRPNRAIIKSIEPSEDNATALITYGMQLYSLHIATPEDDGHGGNENYYGEENSYTWYEWNNCSAITTETLDVPNYQTYIFGEQYLYVRYHKCDASGNVIGDTCHWFYYLNSLTYPKLSPEDNSNEHDTFCPVVPIRYDNVDLTADSLNTTPLHITSKKLLKKAGMDFEDLGEKINENPDVAEIDHAYVLWGINLQNNYSASLHYLGDFFENLFNIQENSKLDYINNLITGGASNGNMYRTQPISNTSFLEHGLNLTITYDYIEVKTEIGELPPYGRRPTKKGDSSKQFLNYESVQLDRVFGFKPQRGGEQRAMQTTRTTKSKMIIRTQIGKRRIRKVTVYGLQSKNLIYHGLSVITTALMVKNNSEENNLFMPVQFNIGEQLRLPLRNLMYTDASLMVINTWKVTKLKWYQSKLFRFIMMIVCVIIIYYTGQAWVALFLEALAAGVMALLIFLIINIVISVAVDYLTDWIVNNLGPELAMILMMVVLVISIVFSFGTSGITIMNQFIMSTAQLMMQVATALISAVNEFLIDEGEKIRNEYLDFEERMADRWEELNTAMEMLPEYNDIFNPIKYNAPSRFKMMPTESPDGFMHRCLGIVNNSMYTVHDQIPNRCKSLMYVNKGVPPHLYNQNIHI